MCNQITGMRSELTPSAVLIDLDDTILEFDGSAD